MKYTYHISVNNEGSFTEVFPTNRPKTSEVKYGVEEFSRKELDMFRLNKSENAGIFPTLETWWDDSTYHGSDMFFEIYRGPRTGTPKYKGIFGIADGTLDKDRGIYEIKSRINDSYKPVTDNYDTAYSTKRMMSFSDDIEYRTALTVNFQNGLPSGGAGFDSFSWSSGIITAVKSSTDQERGCRSTSAISFTTGDILCISYSYSNTESPPNDIEVQIRDSGGGSECDPVTLTRGVGTNLAELTLTGTGDFYICFYAATAETIDCTITISSIYTRERTENCGWNLKEFLQYWLNVNMGTDFSSTYIKSTFFFNDAVSSDCPGTIDTYINANPTHNYVTSAANKLNDTFVAAKWELVSPIKDGGSEFSLNNIMTWLRELYNAYWYIDADGDFRVEHRYWFDLMHTSGLNLTTYESGIYLKGGNAFTWEKDRMYQRESWETVEANGEDFVGEDITYSTSETYPNTRDSKLSVSIDYPYLHDNLGSISTGEFILLHCIQDSGYYVIQNETGIISSTSVANGHFSLANLHDSYHRYGRITKTGTLNDSDVTFESWQRFKLQKTVRFLYTSDVNFTDEITTDEGVGWIKSITRHLITDLVEIELLHDAYAPSEGSALLQESGDYILTEDGYKILL